MGEKEQPLNTEHLSSSRAVDQDSAHSEATLAAQAGGMLYRAMMDEAQSGPQIEGLTSDEAEAALNDQRTIAATAEHSGRRGDIPLVAPLEYSGWYNPSFYGNVDSDERLYFSAPPSSDISVVPGRLRDAFAGKTVSIFYDYLEGDDRADQLIQQLEDAGLTVERIPLGINGPEASITQFAGPAKIKDREGMRPAAQQSFREAVAVSQSAEHIDRSRSARTLSKPVSEEELDQIWAFYAPSFAELNSGHPLLQSFDRESLREMLDAPDSIAAVACPDERIVSLAFLSPLRDCPWLNADHYQAAYPAEFFTGNIVHMPSVVTDKAYRGQDLTTTIFQELVSCVDESKNDVILLGECNDFTVEIIPVLADAFFAGKESRMTLDWANAGVYRYGAIRVSVPQVER